MHATLAAPFRWDDIWADLMSGNRRFVLGKPHARDLVSERKGVAQTQHPKAVVLACADSRVSPEIIFDQGLGDLFVVRIAGNTANKEALGSLEFAAEHFGVSVLVVIGHQHCAAVQAARSGKKVASPNLKAVVTAVRNSLAATSAINEPDALVAAVKANVRNVARSVLDRSEALRRRADSGELAVVSAYYDLESGEVERL
jgi:carbonic anhydrase